MSRSKWSVVSRGSAAETLTRLTVAVDPEALLAATCCHLMILPAGLYSESRHGDVILRLELLAYDLAPSFGRPSGRAPGPDDINAADAAIDELLDENTSPNRWHDARLIDDLRMHAEVVRGTAYPDQTAAWITKVMGPREKWFANRCGIGPRRAVAILEAIVRRHLGVSKEIGAEAAEYAEAGPSSKRNGQRCRMPRWAQQVGASGVAWAHRYSERLCELGPERYPVARVDLEMEQPPEPGEWDALARLIGLTPAARAEMQSAVAMRARPLLVFSDERVILLDWATALENLWLAFESIVKADPAAYEEHQKRRGRTLETQVRDALLRLFPRSSVFHDVSYPDPERGPGATAQLDLLVVWDPFVILIEAKAGQFRLEGRLGEPAVLKTDLTRTIGHGASQLSRAVAYVESTDRPVFQEAKTGRSRRLDMGRICRSYTLLVTHQELVLAARPGAVRELGILPETPLPITMAAANLDTISQFCAGPEVFLHYLERRSAVQQSPHEILADEMNLFGAYLDNRLRLVDELVTAVGEEPVSVVWTALSERFDSESMHRLSGAPAGESIRLKLPLGIDDLLGDLRSSGGIGSRRIAFELLDLPRDELLAVAGALYRLRNDGLPAPGMHRRIVVEEGSLLIQALGVTQGSPAEISEVLIPRTLAEQRRRGARIAMGFGVDLISPDQPVVTAVWCGEGAPSQQIPDITNLEPTHVKPVLGWRPPGRNEPCWCGSGRKHKRCCLGRLTTPTN